MSPRLVGSDRVATVILGAGVTGLAAGLDNSALVLEAASKPGGLCRSYYVAPAMRAQGSGPGSRGFRFEIGGGHWVFGVDAKLGQWLAGFGTWRRYRRRAAIFFPETGWKVPYPLQYHLGYLPGDLARRALAEMEQPKPARAVTLAAWLEQTFGPTLFRLFFRPFNELYTAGLLEEISPEEDQKNPVDPALVREGMQGRAVSAGYNADFLYPEAGLDWFVDRLAARANLRLGRRVTAVDCRARQVLLEDGTAIGYDTLISTLPLDQMLTLANIQVPEPPDPATSLLVLNLACVRGPRCPNEHWIYLPATRAGFHRVGFYSNVDRSFLPEEGDGLVSLYVERAFPRSRRPEAPEQSAYLDAVLCELRQWGWIRDLIVSSSNWLETAYTWVRPGSRWRQAALSRLAEHGVRMLGRFGRWRFQGIADSLREGLGAGQA